ncbi:MAG: hypothetical protein KAH32_08940 [Chlamydiia bacterium]|nr:hypothetical protein [Chlamydiia bacterium]
MSVKNNTGSSVAKGRTITSQLNRSVDGRYISGVKKQILDNKGMDWYNYPLTGKAPC